MTAPIEDGPLGRALALLMVGVFRAAFGCFAIGLALWLAQPASAGSRLLDIGLLGLLAIPLLRVVSVLAAAARSRDRITLLATIAVLAILIALTLRDAGMH